MKNIRRLSTFAFILLSFALILGACGGGGSDNNNTASPPPTGTYNAAGSVGDLLTYTLNNNLEYTYSVEEGIYKGSTGSGTLTPLTGYGNYVYTTTLGDPVVLLPNNLVIAGAMGMMIVGVPELTTDYTPSEIAGLYNYVEYVNSAQSYGTFEVFEDGTWKSWDETNKQLSTSDGSGTWVDQGNGVIEVMNGSTKIANAMLLPSSDGGKVIVIDYTGSRSGIGAGVKQASIGSGTVNGTYDTLSSIEDNVFEVTVSGTNVTTPEGTITISYNCPWTGLVCELDGGDIVGIYLVTPDGIFFGGYDHGFVSAIVAGIKQ